MKHSLILFNLFFGLIFGSSERFLVEINFNKIRDLNLLSHLEIHYDHHRSYNNVHAFVDEIILNEIKKSLTRNEACEIRGFGRFSTNKQKADLIYF